MHQLKTISTILTLVVLTMVGSGCSARLITPDEYTAIQTGKPRIVYNHVVDDPSPPRLIEITWKRFMRLPYDGWASKRGIECRSFRSYDRHGFDTNLCFSRRNLNTWPEPKVMQFWYRTTDRSHNKHVYRFRDHRPQERFERPRYRRFQQYKSYLSGGSVFIGRVK